MTIGLNLRLADLPQIESTSPEVDFWEVIAENLFDRPDVVERVAALGRPVSLHAVGMNLAGTDPIDLSYLERIGALLRSLDICRLSDHLCWQSHRGVSHHDLLPFPRTVRSLERIVGRVERVQQYLGCAIAVENLSTYVEFTASVIEESAILNSLADRTGCGILLDLNNLEVNEHNLGVPASDVLEEIDLSAVVELHVAGADTVDGLQIDTHGGEPTPQQRRWLRRPELQQIPLCYERDQHRPPLAQRLATLGGLR